MKGLILAGGKGTRLRPFTYTTAKQLIPVANKPILGYVLEKFADSTVDEVYIIISPETGNEIKNYVGDGSEFGLKVKYVLQREPLGLAHAVKVAHEEGGLEGDFLMYLGDNLLNDPIQPLIDAFYAEKADSLILLTKVKNPSQFGVAEVRDGRIVRLVEKPKQPPSDLALVGVYLFNDSVYEAVNAIKPSFRGELEITDAIDYLLRSGRKVVYKVVVGWWKDTGKVEDLLSANVLVLDSKSPIVDVERAKVINSHIEGFKVFVGENTVIENSVLRGPLLIGNNVVIRDSYVGPYTSISDNVEIMGSELENSIILEGARILNFPSPIDRSVIGRYAVVKYSEELPRRTSLHVGDRSHLEVSFK